MNLLINLAGKEKNRKDSENELETGLLISIALFFVCVWHPQPLTKIKILPIVKKEMIK